MGKGDSKRPQQEELARSRHSQADPRHWTEREEAGAEPEDPTVEADRADPAQPGPGDSEGSRPE
jgi:hypothetical protein